jgi:geranylgeranyl reductase family protein
MQQFDVLIAGAGPAGSSAAIALARRGYVVALLDKEQFPREKLCGDFLNPINWPMLRELDVEKELLSRPHKKVVSFRLTTFFGEEVEVPIKNGETGFGLGLRRAHLDDVLLRKAESEGAAVLQRCRVKQLKRDSRDWLAECDCAGTVEELRARMLVGADGRNSWIAHRLGLTSGRFTRGKSVGFQFHLRCSSAIGHNVEIHLFRGGYAGVVGLGGDTINLCLAIEKNRLSGHRSAEPLLNSCLTENPWLKEFLRGERVSDIRSTYPVYFSSRRAYDDAVLLIGDAASVNEPVTGEGIYFAMRSGLFAADAIDEAFGRSDFSAARLSDYASRCHRAFRFRRRINALVRLLIYRPTFLSRLISRSGRRSRFIDPIVRAICRPDIANEGGSLITRKSQSVALE